MLMSTITPNGPSIMSQCADYDKLKSYAADYRRRHPEKVKQWNLNKAVNLLKKNGFTVIPPADAAAVEGGAVDG